MQDKRNWDIVITCNGEKKIIHGIQLIHPLMSSLATHLVYQPINKTTEYQSVTLFIGN